MAKHGVATISTSTAGGGVRTCAADLSRARHQSVFDAAMAPTQESGLRENCTSRLSERAEGGRKPHLPRLYSNEAGEQSEGSLLRRRLGGRTQRSRGSEGRGPRGIRTSTTRTGLRARLACQTRWSVYGNFRRHTPEAGAVCGKAARTDLGGGRAMKRTSLPLRVKMKRREFISLLGGAATAWPLAARAQQGERVRRVGILMPFPPTNAEMQARVRTFREQLRKLGWAAGVNAQFDERWTSDNMDLIRSAATNLVELNPDAILASGGRVIPILL